MPDKQTIQLLAGIAHELNTPLGAIRSNSEVIETGLRRIGEVLASSLEVSGMKETMDVLENSIRINRLACERLIAIAHNLRHFAKVEDSARTRVDIHLSIETSLALLAHELKHRIRVVREFGTVHDTTGFVGQINQLFLNILQNAVQSIEGNGEIRIKTWETGDAVHIAITDTGRGIAPDLIPRIFESGFSTQSDESNDGLGLAICQDIVRNHNGRIEVQSEQGKGSTFTIHLERKTDE